MINPFYLYSVSIIIVLFFFSLRWSNYFQDLNTEYYIFIIISAIFNLIIGIILRKYLKFRPFSGKPIKVKIIFIIFSLGYLLDFIYSGYIPIISAISNSAVHYKDIKHLPAIYPILIALNVFFAIYYMYIYISLKEKKYLYTILLLLSYFAVLMGRGILVMALVAIVFMYLSSLNKAVFKKSILKLIVIMGIFAVVFGLLGNVRPITVEKYKHFGAMELLMYLGNATEEFKDSSIPKILFPLYLYIASPAANLSNTFEHANKNNNDITEFIVYNFFPQSIQKRVLPEYELYKSFLVIDTFNVSTAWALPFVQFNFIGIIFFEVTLLLIFIIMFVIIYKSNYKVIFLSLFTSFMVLSQFDNILIFDNIMIPMILCTIFALKDKILYK